MFPLPIITWSFIYRNPLQKCNNPDRDCWGSISNYFFFKLRPYSLIGVTLGWGSIQYSPQKKILSKQWQTSSPFIFFTLPLQFLHCFHTQLPTTEILHHLARTILPETHHFTNEGGAKTAVPVSIHIRHDKPGILLVTFLGIFGSSTHQGTQANKTCHLKQSHRGSQGGKLIQGPPKCF